MFLASSGAKVVMIENTKRADMGSPVVDFEGTKIPMTLFAKELNSLATSMSIHLFIASRSVFDGIES